MPDGRVEKSFTAAADVSEALAVLKSFNLTIQGAFTGQLLLERKPLSGDLAFDWGLVRSFTGPFEGWDSQLGDPFEYRVRSDAGFAGTALVRLGGSTQQGAGNVFVRPSTISRKDSPSQGDAVEVTTSGDTDVYDPAAGKRIRLKWLGFSSSPDMAAATKVTARFGSNAPFYSWWMGAPGAFAHGFIREGGVDEKLIVNCSVAPGGGTPLLVNIDVEEIP